MLSEDAAPTACFGATHLHAVCWAVGPFCQLVGPPAAAPAPAAPPRYSPLSLLTLSRLCYACVAAGECRRANVCGNVRGESRLQISCQLGSCHWAGCPSRRPCAAHARLAQCSRPSPAMLRASAGADMLQSIMFQLSAGGIDKADSCVGSGPAVGTDEAARHFLACAVGSENVGCRVERQGPAPSCGGRPRYGKVDRLPTIKPSEISTCVRVRSLRNLWLQPTLWTICTDNCVHGWQHCTDAHRQLCRLLAFTAQCLIFLHSCMMTL